MGALARAPKFAKIVYPIRAGGLLLQCLGAITVWWVGPIPGAFWILVAICFVWPHVAYLRTLGKDHEAELQNFLGDALLCGLCLSVVSFNAIVSVSAVSALVTNCLAAGGSRLLLRALLVFPVGIALGSALFGFKLEPASSTLTILACAPGLVLYAAFVASTTYRETRGVAAIRRVIREEKAKSEALLLNVLPVSIAERLKKTGQPIADGFVEVTVLFGDLVGFTKLAETIPAEQVVELLNEVFSEFDDHADRLGLEKIKTIGDAYMVAAGLPEPRADHAEAAAEMALAMAAVVSRVAAKSGRDLAMRIGIHTGPVVAGIIGKRKFSYDLWGDTVNTASRMESHGVAGEIQVSEAVREKLAAGYSFQDRGEIELKGKGRLRAYLLRRAAA